MLTAVVITALTACSKNSGDSSVAIDMDSAADAGNVSINVPRFDAKLRLPTDVIAHGDFDIDGVNLYSESEITAFNLNVDDNKNMGQDVDRSVIKMGFAALAVVSSVTR